MEKTTEVGIQTGETEPTRYYGDKDWMDGIAKRIIEESTSLQDGQKQSYESFQERQQYIEALRKAMESLS